ncbi:hypothetical protein CHS0354_037289 [Potamilus streckersoni]|uniref:Uncharacterized protein n=1 Tax=Potamilus streckersoni TaxID=2493646 RepID=A0AAE0W2M2_9BIVA|nr:hypothetical protein CHS0354_037289 [Potamilus streckersoni]
MEPDVLHDQLRFAFQNTDSNKILDIINDENFDINQRDITHDLQTVLMKMCYLNLNKNEMEEIMASVFERDPDVNAQDSWGRTAIMHSCIADNSVVFDSLMDHSLLRLEMLDFEGNSVLSYAVKNEDFCMVEDILQQQSGLELINIYNSKGQSPLSLAKKMGKRNICNLFESVVNESPNSERKSKPRHRKHEEISPLALGYSPSPERRSQNAFSTVYVSPKERKQNKDMLKEMKKLNLQDDLSSDKYEFHNTSRKETHLDEAEIRHPLILTSANLERSKHKDECARDSSMCSGNIILPSLVTGECENVDFPKKFEKKKRRGSISLPDLRNMKRCLVNSEGNSPNYSKGNVDKRARDIDSISQDSDDDDDNVFTQSFPSARSKKLEGRLGKKLNSLRRCETEKQLRLPEIAPHIDTRSKTNLSRVRKRSSSEDQLQRVLIQQ